MIQDLLRGLMAFLSLGAITLGCWWERPSLGLIVPGALVFGSLAWAKIKGRL